MTAIALTVNGEPTRAEVAPRTHLADFLREELSLTGTHLGCEQGVCGACTVLIDGVPTRSCIAFAVTCDGQDVRTIEGFGDDPLMGELRAAFSEHHALQCGFCTPGMLISSRDIIRRLGEVDERTIRHELSGNLCRCTGYMGIVRAVRAVSVGKVAGATPARTPVAIPPRQGRAEQARSAARGGAETPGLSVSRPAPDRAFGATRPSPRGEGSAAPGSQAPAGASSTMVPAQGGWTELTQVVCVDAPADRVWQAMKDIRQVASCLPGASVAAFDGSQVEGTLAVKFGPIRASFQGDGNVSFEDGTSSGLIEGGGRDRRTGTQARGEIRFGVRQAGAGSEIDVAMRYRVTGALAQFARTTLVRNFVDHLAGIFAENLARTLSGGAPASAAGATGPELNTLAVLLALARGWLQRVFGR